MPEDEGFERALLNTSVIAQLPVLLSGQAIKEGVLSHPVDAESCLYLKISFPIYRKFIGASPILSDVPKGHIAPLIDSDGAVRKMPALVCVGDRLYAALPVAPFFAAFGTDSWDVNIELADGLFSPTINYLWVLIPDWSSRLTVMAT